jgi:hypothetical protein
MVIDPLVPTETGAVPDTGVVPRTRLTVVFVAGPPTVAFAVEAVTWQGLIVIVLPAAKGWVLGKVEVITVKMQEPKDSRVVAVLPPELIEAVWAPAVPPIEIVVDAVVPRAAMPDGATSDTPARPAVEVDDALRVVVAGARWNVVSSLPPQATKVAAAKTAKEARANLFIKHLVKS